MPALETAWREAERTLEREHTTPFFWENPDRFRLGNVAWETGLDYSMSHRWTIDYQADYDFIRTVYEDSIHRTATSHWTTFWPIWRPIPQWRPSMLTMPVSTGIAITSMSCEPSHRP